MGNMKMRIYAGLVLFCLTMSSLATAQLAKQQAPDFRKARWGMSQAEVKSLESAKLHKEQPNKDGLFFGGSVGEFDDVLIAYIFVDDKLVRAGYSFMDRHANDNLYIDDFHKVKATIEEKYGKSEGDDMFWKDDLYKDDPDNYGMAVSAGHLVYEASWTTDRTEILETLRGDNFKIDLRVQYSSVELRSLEDEKKKKNDNSDF